MPTDIELFRRVAEQTSQRLLAYGVRSTTIRKNTAEANGWWTTIASWAENRPSITVWCDHFLGDQHPYFWFGFFAPKERPIQELLTELSSLRPVEIVDADGTSTAKRGWQLSAAKIRSLKQGRGISLERYKSDREFFLGRYAVRFKNPSVDQLVSFGAKFIGDIVQTVEPELSREADLNELEQLPASTTKKQLIDARLGQGGFRRALVKYWDGCALLGCHVDEVLRASHIKRWRDSSKRERLDPNNGLLLSATLDALFERRLISFRDDGSLIVSGKLSKVERSLILHRARRKLRKSLTSRQKYYLGLHRAELAQP